MSRKPTTADQLDAAIARTEWIGRLTAAREAVVEAARNWVNEIEIVIAVRKARELRAAVAALRDVEKEMENG